MLVRLAMSPPLLRFSSIILTNPKMLNPKSLKDEQNLLTMPLYFVHSPAHTVGSSIQQQPSSQKAVKQNAGVLEGCRLLLKYDYIKGIFALSCLFMVQVTILDYAMKVVVELY